MPAELSGVICLGIVLLPHVSVMCMCVYGNVVACSERNYYYYYYYYFYYYYYVCYY